MHLTTIRAFPRQVT